VKNEDPSKGFWREHIINRLHPLEKMLLLTNEHADAISLITDEEAFLNDLYLTTAEAKRHAGAGLAYLRYMRETWLNESIWSSWSQHGRDRASTKLQRPVEGILPTTNHLESFNAVLKRKYIPAWQRSGNRLRFDIFIHHLILKILPEIFAQRRMQHDFHLWVSQRFHQISGGQDLRKTDKPQKSNPTTLSPSDSSILAWFSEDPARDQKAQQIVAVSRICQIPSGRPYEVWATCAASNADVQNSNHLRYWLTLHPTGSATCSCYDWITNGGACKHLRALQILVQSSSKLSLPLSSNSYHFPVSRANAEIITQRNKAWYGPYIDVSVTPYRDASTISKSNAGSPSTNQPDMLTNCLPDSAHPAPLAPPGQPVSARALRDASLFQYIAGDSSQLEKDGYITEDDGLSSASESDNSDTQLSNTAPSATVTSDRSNLHAIALQVKHRLQQDVPRVLPLLHGISSVLESSSGLSLSGAQELGDLNEAVLRLSEQLQQVKFHQRTASIMSVSPPRPNLTSMTPPMPISNPKVPIRKHLLPPSPETKQKRKKSNGIL
jgi:SWIM zinc finger